MCGAAESYKQTVVDGQAEVLHQANDPLAMPLDRDAIGGGGGGARRRN